MADSTIVDRASQAIQAEIAGALRGHCQTLPQPEHADAFGTFFDRFGDARIVLLGEATHGSSDFYKARAAITRHLIHHHGFSFVAAEADWPDAARIDRYVRHREPEPSRSEAFARFPTWMWHNTDVMALVDWLRGHNQNLPPDRRVSFHGSIFTAWACPSTRSSPISIGSIPKRPRSRGVATDVSRPGRPSPPTMAAPFIAATARHEGHPHGLDGGNGLRLA
ncbi:MAG TPA: erythromycin esterase family protein [Bryobacteraceae bacterium]|nr:erythromycin esterase family protein [Bryobacteraceae bacterium]